MPYPADRNIHRPPHIYKNNIYFVTGRTINKTSFFKLSDKKEIFIKVFNIARNKYKINIYAWVLLNNHYHLLIGLDNKFRSAQFVNPKTNNKLRHDKIETQFAMPKYQLVEFIRALHKDSARIINQFDHVPGRRIWYQYWDHCIRREADFYRHFNYIHQNPIKHRLYKNLDELKNFPFSSYNDWIQKKGGKWIINCFEKYPIKDFVERSEESVDTPI